MAISGQAFAGRTLLTLCAANFPYLLAFFRHSNARESCISLTFRGVLTSEVAHKEAPFLPFTQIAATEGDRYLKFYENPGSVKWFTRPSLEGVPDYAGYSPGLGLTQSDWSLWSRKMLKGWSSAIVAGPILCLLETTGPPVSALDRHIELTNTTRRTIVELFAAEVGSGDWQIDVLGDDFLPSGGTAVVDIKDRSGYCRFDLKAVFDDGSELIRRDINICALEGYTLSYR
jgi:hypothetical protein